MNVVEQTNSIIREWKTGYIETANRLTHMNLPPDLANKSYAEILGAAAAKGLSYDGILQIMGSLAQTIGGFDRYPEVSKAYNKIFGSALDLIDYLYINDLGVARDLPKEERYIISPAGEKANEGRPMGLREVPDLPEVLELFFVTPDPDALAIEDIYVDGFLRSFTMKGVGELPPDMVEYAKANNIKLR